MDNSNIRLCWKHRESPMAIKSDASFCTNSSELSDNGLPSCHVGCDYYFKCNKAFERATLPDFLWDTASNFHPDMVDANNLVVIKHIRKDILSFVKEGRNLCICSNLSGNGKTSRAATLMCEYISRCIENGYYKDKLARYVYVPKFVTDYDFVEKLPFEHESRRTFIDFIESLRYSDIVIFDCLGFDSKTKAEDVIIRSVINDRLNSKKCSIFVFNRGINDIPNYLDKSDWQRISSSSFKLEFNANSYRDNDFSKYLVGGM